MKQVIEFEMDNPIDAARFGLHNNIMNIMNAFSALLGCIEVYNEKLKDKEIDMKDFVRLIMEFQARVESDMTRGFAAYNYIQHDGVCDACRDEDKDLN